MMTSVYLSNNTIQVLVGTQSRGKILVKELHRVGIAEGSIINGVITNEAELLEEIRNIWRQYQLPTKNIGLVIDSTQFILKTASIPKLNQKKSLEIVKREFSDLEERQDPIYAYMNLYHTEEKSPMHEMMCAATERSFIESFITVFEQLGISVGNITPALCSAIRLFGAHPQLSKETCIIQLLDGDNLVSVLLLDGKHKYSNRSRLFGEHGSDAFSVEVGRNVSSIVQFNASEKSGYEIKNVYFGGFDKEDLNLCMQSVNTLGLHAQPFPDMSDVVLPFQVGQEEETLGDYVYPLGNLVGQGLNFYAQYKKDPKAQEKEKKRKTIIIPMAVVFGVVLLASATLFLSNLHLQKQGEQLTAYIENPEAKEQYAKSVETGNNNIVLQRNIKADTHAWEAIASYPKPNSKVVAEIQSCAADQVSIELTNYIAETGAFSFIATAANVTDINAFIAKLEQMDSFAKVEYSGYGYREEKQVYDIKVACYLSAEAGK